MADGPAVGDTAQMRGYVTVLKSCVGRSSADLERSLGYSAGTLATGYTLWLLEERVEPGEFLLRGYTQFSGGKAAGSDVTTHTARRTALKSHPVDTATWQRILADAAERLGKTGVDQVCKVRPLVRPDGYPAGDGVVQYEITVPKTFRCAALVTPGQKVTRLPTGEIVTRPV